MNSGLATKAIELATLRHGFQQYGFRPYTYHLLGVAEAFKRNETLYISAILHDIIEDTDTLNEELVKLFGAKIADIVLCLTKREDEGYFEYINKIRAHPNARKIKIEDLNFNLRHNPPKSLFDRYTKALGLLTKNQT